MSQQKNTYDIKVGSVENRVLLALRFFIQPTYSDEIINIVRDVDCAAVHKALNELANKGLIIKTKTNYSSYVLTQQGRELVNFGGELSYRRNAKTGDNHAT